MTTNTTENVASEEKIRAIVNEIFDERMDQIKQMIVCIVNTAMLKPHEPIPTPRRKTKKVAAIKHNDFGAENYSYIHVGNIIKKSADMMIAMQNIIIDLYFDIRQKTNHIIYIPPTSYKCVAILKDGAWKNYDIEPSIEKVIRRANDVMQHFMIGANEADEIHFRKEIGHKKYDLLKEFTDKVDNMEDHVDFLDRLFKETEHTIITNQHLVHKDIYDASSDE
jgi:hypothetical protein